MQEDRDQGYRWHQGSPETNRGPSRGHTTSHSSDLHICDSMNFAVNARIIPDCSILNRRPNRGRHNPKISNLLMIAEARPIHPDTAGRRCLRGMPSTVSRNCCPCVTRLLVSFQVHSASCLGKRSSQVPPAADTFPCDYASAVTAPHCKLPCC
jgi:hypothetical protein